MSNIGAGRHFQKQTKGFTDELLIAVLSNWGRASFHNRNKTESFIIFPPKVLIKNSHGCRVTISP